MSLVIGSNPAALIAAHHTRTTASGMQSAMERLASGSRISSSADDAAGVSIAAKLESQVRGLDMALRNAADSKAAMQMADGALIEVENMLQRVRELAVQKASGTYSTNDTNAINAEIDALMTEAAAITNATSGSEFNDKAFFSTTDFAPANKDGTAGDMVIGAIDVSGVTNASAATAVDTLITTVTTARGSIGAFINQLDFRINNYSNLSANTAAAQSTIADTDYAAESANLAKFQILQQAGTAMLAQANASQQSVLALLQ